MAYPRKDRLLPIADEGMIFILPLTFFSFLSYTALGWKGISYLLFTLTVFCIYFFRDPERAICTDPQKILSPADGKVVRIEEKENDKGEKQWQISVFLTIFNVHINRSPLAGTVTDVSYREGAFKAAFDHDASEVNEQNSVTVTNESISITFVQIAGLIARRIICWNKPGDLLAQGERYGLIRFGSRMDIFVPQNQVDLKVKVGDKVSGGLTILACLKSPS